MEHLRVCGSELTKEVPSLGVTWMEEAVRIWGTSCQRGSLSPRLQGKRNSAPQAPWRQSCAGYKVPGGTPGPGSPLAGTETAPSIATTDFSFCGKCHALSRKGVISLHWPSE